MSTNKGRKLLLHKRAFPDMEGPPDEFRAIEIVEVKSVKGDYSDNIHEGWRAIDKDGNHYTVNWLVFDELSSTPTWMWFCEETTEPWYDVTQGMFAPVDFKPIWLDEYKDIVHWCKPHCRLSNATHVFEHTEDSVTRASPCFQCAFGMPPSEPESSQKWNGWK